MKVLLFTHAQDIDGMGCAVIAKEAFKDIKIIPCKTFEITSKVDEYIKDGSINNYDLVYVTDLCIKEPLLSYINDNNKLKEKIKVIDHHKSEIDEGNNKYDFVSIIIEENGIKESGTSLFYKYLINNNYLKRSNCLDTLVEWTRQYDVWDWEKQNNINARYLHILFEVLGYEKYLEIAKNFIIRGEVTFRSTELKVINDFLEELEKDIIDIISKMKVVTIKINDKEYRIGYVRCPYKYRNDINGFVIKDNINNIDTVGMIMTDIDTVSYRNVKDIDTSIIAVYFGGKGHKNAASNPQNNPKFIELVNTYNL